MRHLKARCTSKLFTKAQYYFGNILSKAPNYWILFGKNNHIMFKTQNYSLAKTYFYTLNSLTHGKHKLLYSSFKTTSSTKFMRIMLIFSIRNSNYKSLCILPMSTLFICSDEQAQRSPTTRPSPFASQLDKFQHN